MTPLYRGHVRVYVREGVISYMTLKTSRFPLPLISRASFQRGGGGEGGRCGVNHVNREEGGGGDIGNHVSKVNEIRRKLSSCG